MLDEPLKPDAIQEIIDYQKRDKEFWDRIKGSKVVSCCTL
jgi:hypothetical protein